MSNNKLDTYLDLCTEVYDLSKPNPPKTEYDFYHSYVKSVRDVVLEPMCGTGRFLLPLLEEGFDVRGFDTSRHMLNSLHKKARLRKLQPKVWCGFLENFAERNKYALIFIPSGSFGLVTDLRKIRLCTKRIYDGLKTSGLFVFEIETIRATPKQTNVWRSHTWQRENSGTIVANFLDLPLKNNIHTTLCRYELKNKSKIIKTENENFKVRLYKPDQMTRILKAIGFSDITMIKAFNRTKRPSKDAKSIIYECRKL